MQGKAAPSPLGSTHDAAAAARAANPSYHSARLRFAVAEKVARLLIGFRKHHGLTQVQLAAALGMKESAVSRLESGEHIPNFATLGRIAETCDVDVVFDFAKRPTKSSAVRRTVIPA